MRPILVAACVACLHTAPVYPAFELSRSIVPAVPTFDPLAPRALTWLSNPATLTLSGRLAGAGFARPFGLAALDMLYGEVIVPRSRSVFALGLTTLGQSELYRESDLSLGVAMRLSGSFSLGLTAHYLALNFGRGFAPLTTAAFGTGIWYQRPTGLAFGLSIADVAVPLDDARELLQPAIRAALGYRHSPSLALRAGAEHRDRWVFALGETVLVADQVHLKADLLTDPIRLSVGMRLHVGGYFIDFTYRDHPDLGGDQMIGLGRRF